ncbi:hypothetical protein RP20_CCG016117 [Aedes albopictus]|nr:hypothetical protein RP20_CCG016117 [Aedes albopictus]
MEFLNRNVGAWSAENDKTITAATDKVGVNSRKGKAEASDPRCDHGFVPKKQARDNRALENWLDRGHNNACNQPEDALSGHVEPVRGWTDTKDLQMRVFPTQADEVYFDSENRLLWVGRLTTRPLELYRVRTIPVDSDRQGLDCQITRRHQRLKLK